MRILVVSQYFWPENFRINDLAAELVERGHQVTVLTGIPNYPQGTVFPAFKSDPSKFSEYKGVDIVRVPMFSRGSSGISLILNYISFAVNASVIGLWRLRGHQFDVIFTCQLSPVTVGLPAALMRFIKRTPLVLWVLDLWPDTLQAIGIIRSPFLLKVVGWLVSFIYGQCDLILAQSKGFIPLIKKYSDPNSRVLYFPSWAEALFSSSQNIALVTPHEIPKQIGSLKIMFAGNIGEAQDFPAILDAAQALKKYSHIQWLILGDGRVSGWVKKEIFDRQLQDCVHMLGRHPLESMPAFFKSADVLLVSLQDKPIFALTIPGKIQSYMTSGIPCIGMLNGEGAEVIRLANAGLVCAAGDAQGLARAVLEFDRMSLEQRREIGENGKRFSDHEFNRSTLISRLENWLASVQLQDNSKTY